MATSDCITIPLTRGYSTVIDAIDSDLADFNWSTLPGGETCYAKRSGKRSKGKRPILLMHRIILSRILGRDLLPDEYPDHIDLNGLNNRRENLRLATHAQNMWNQRIAKNNASGFKGVSRYKKGYRAYIQINGKGVCLGSFPTPELAAAAYNEIAIKYRGKFARLNVLPQPFTSEPEPVENETAPEPELCGCCDGLVSDCGGAIQVDVDRFYCQNTRRGSW